MLTKRIIPCLDIMNEQVVKGINFKGIKEVGDPVELGKRYYHEGADELVFLDITATHEKRKTMVEVARKIAKEIFIPFTIGGGISTVLDMKDLLRAGADKISVNSAAIKNPALISEGATIFGSQCIVLAIDAKKREDNTGWNVFINGGRKDTGIDLLSWVKQGISLGAGEILLTSMDADGTKNGFDIDMCEAVNKSVHVPVIASGGCGKLEDFFEVFATNSADAALAASVFHYESMSIGEVKAYLQKKGIAVRL